MASLVSLSLKTRGFIFMWPPVSLLGWWPWCGHLEPPDPSDTDATDEEIDAELLSLLNLWSDESEGVWGGATPNSHCLWPLSWPCWCAQPCSRWGRMRTKSGHLPSFNYHWNVSRPWTQILVMKIKWSRKWVRSNKGDWTLLIHMHPSAMAWVINCQPPHWLAGLALSWACLLTQLRAPDNINVASHASPKLSPSPNDHSP